MSEPDFTTAIDKLPPGLRKYLEVLIAIVQLVVAIAGSVAASSHFLDVAPPGTAFSNAFFLSIISVVPCLFIYFLGSYFNSKGLFLIISGFSATFFLMTCLSYLYLTNEYVWSDPIGNRKVIGDVMHPEVDELRKFKGWSEEELRQKSKNFDLSTIYTHTSIARRTSMLQIVWLATSFFFFSFLPPLAHVITETERTRPPLESIRTEDLIKEFEQDAGAATTKYLDTKCELYFKEEITSEIEKDTAVVRIQGRQVEVVFKHKNLRGQKSPRQLTGIGILKSFENNRIVIELRNLNTSKPDANN